MPTPLGHVLASFVAGRSFQKKTEGWDWPKLFFLMFCGAAPDLDFIPGILTGEIYRYHHKFSHSILGAVLLGFIFWGIYGLWRKTWQGRDLFLILLTVLLHPILDIFVADPSAPYGCPLFMPFTNETFMSRWVFFERTSLYESIFEARNLRSLFIEFAVFFPYAAVLSLRPPRKAYLWVIAVLLSGSVILCSSRWVRYNGDQVYFEKVGFKEQ